MLSILSFLLSLLALAFAGFLLSRHWKEMRLLDPNTIKKERERQKRESIIRRRFERMGAEGLEPVKRLGRRLADMSRDVYSRACARLQAMENFYKNIKSPLAVMTPSTRDRVKTLLTEAKALSRDLKWADAERRYIEVLSLDTHEPEGYKGLGYIYLKQKLYPQAKETFEFLVKMKKTDDTVYAGLAEIAEAEGNPALAETMFIKAMESSPRQAHRHAELAMFYLNRHDAQKALLRAKRASALEPKSSKYLELCLESAILAGDAKEARERLSRLRLVSDDQEKFQTWKQKVEEMTVRITT